MLTTDSGSNKGAADRRLTVGKNLDMSKCKWRAIFSIEPGLQKSETSHGYEFQVHEDGSTLVVCTYETEAYDERHIQARDTYEYAEETLATLDSEKLREIMLKRMVFQKLFTKLSIQLKGKVELTNREELASEGVHFRRKVGSAHTLCCPMLDVGDSVGESERFWMHGFRGLSANQEPEVLRIADWLERSYAESDPTNRFIMVWIAFNGLYGLYSATCGNMGGRESNQFASLVRGLVDVPEDRKILTEINNSLSTLRHSNLHLGRGQGRRNVSRELDAKLTTVPVDERDALIAACKCIYSVRNNVFHNAPRKVDIDSLVRAGTRALLPITTHCLRKFVDT